MIGNNGLHCVMARNKGGNHGFVQRINYFSDHDQIQYGNKLAVCRGVWMSIMVLYVASCIIFPIIFKEGPRAVFMPILVRKPKVSVSDQELCHELCRSQWYNSMRGCFCLLSQVHAHLQVNHCQCRKHLCFYSPEVEQRNSPHNPVSCGDKMLAALHQYLLQPLYVILCSILCMPTMIS